MVYNLLWNSSLIWFLYKGDLNLKLKPDRFKVLPVREVGILEQKNVKRITDDIIFYP